jgi:hypothetical protein
VTALSSRPAFPVIALAVVAAIPIAWHAIAAPTADACRDAEALLGSEWIGEGRVTDHWPPLPGPTDVLRIGGEIAGSSDDVAPMKFRLSRGFEPLTYYATSEIHDIDPTFATDVAGHRVELEADGATLPVYWLEDSLESKFRLRAYFYAFEGRPVEHVFPAGVAAAARQLVHGTLPVTLFVVRAEGQVSASDAMRGAARDWLRAAWARHQEVCAP